MYFEWILYSLLKAMWHVLELFSDHTEKNWNVLCHFEQTTQNNTWRKTWHIKKTHQENLAPNKKHHKPWPSQMALSSSSFLLQTCWTSSSSSVDILSSFCSSRSTSSHDGSSTLAFFLGLERIGGPYTK